MYEIKSTTRFEKDAIRCIKRRLHLSQLETVVSLLETTGNLPAKYKTHPLKCNYNDCLESHIKPDWILIWKQDDKQRTIVLIATGTHSDLFK